MSYTVINNAGSFIAGNRGNSLDSTLGTIADQARGNALGQIASATGFGINPTIFTALGPDTVSTFTADVVGIFDESFVQVVESARPMRASVQEYSRAMEHPVESGGVVTDWAVIMPVEIALTVFCASEDYRATYQSIKTLWLTRQFLTVQTKTDTYSNMLLVGMPHEEDADQYDMVAMQLRFKEVILISAQFQALTPAQAGPTDQSTIARGEQQGGGSILFQAGKSLGLFSK